MANHLDSLPLHVRALQQISLGIYRGLDFGLVLHPQFTPEVYLAGAIVRQSMLSHHGPRAVLNAAERLANGYGDELDRVRQDVDIAQSQLRDYQVSLGKNFPHEAVLSELVALRDRLKACLSGRAPEPDAKSPSSISELAKQINTLKAANTLATRAEHVGKCRSSAEEPITARIRRRMGAILFKEFRAQSGST